MAGAYSLPRQFPIFPLRGCLVLPGGNLPLNIFEPRYLAMVKDAMDGDRMIGMIQPREAQGNALFRTGCLCRIATCEPTDDGRLEIVLVGLCRFDIATELKAGTAYRQVEAEIAPWLADLDPPDPPDSLRPRLLAATRTYFGLREITTDWESLGRTPLLPLITALAMLCPFTPAEKQALLQARDGVTQGELLVTMMQMETPGADGSEPLIRH